MGLYLAFGSQVEQYRSIPESFFSCIYAIFDTLDAIDEMRSVSFILSHYSVITYMLLMTILAFSIFIAIVDNAYVALLDCPAMMLPTLYCAWCSL